MSPWTTVRWPLRFWWDPPHLYVVRPGSSPLPIATGVIVITDRYQDSLHNTYCRLWFERDEHWASVVVPLDILSSTEKIKTLAQYGVPFLQASYVRDFLWSWYLQNQEAMPTYPAPDQNGWWKPGVFVWGPTLWQRGMQVSDQVFVLNPTFRGWQALQASTSEAVELTEWRWWKRHILSVAPQLSLGLAAMGAALLLGVRDRPGFVLHIADQTSTGKTTTLSLLASALGDPRETTGLVRKWQSDPEEIAQWATWMRDTVWFLDDATHVSATALTDQIYWLVSGNPPNTLLSTRGIVLSTSETALPQTTAGVGARVLDWNASWIPFGAPVDLWMAHVALSDRWGWALPRLMRGWMETSTATLTRALRRPPPQQTSGLINRWQGYWNTLVAGSLLWRDKGLTQRVLEAETQWWHAHLPQEG